MEFATPLVGDLARRVFAQSASGPSNETLDARLWTNFQSTGLDRLLTTGEPTALQDAIAMLHIAGFHVGRIPAAEVLLAHGLASRAGWDETSMLPIALPSVVEGVAVPWGRSATALYFLHDGCIARCQGPMKVACLGSNLAGEPRDAIAWPKDAFEVSSTPMDADEVLCLHALCRAAMLAGAMERALDLAVGYAGERVQFGQTIATFQAVQQMMAQLAAHAAVAAAAVELAVARFSGFTAAIAKSRASEAAGPVAEIAHQVVGAMGFTVEYPLHHATRRLWAWRDEHGSEFFWNRRIGALALSVGEGALWPVLSGTAAVGQEWRQ